MVVLACQGAVQAASKITMPKRRQNNWSPKSGFSDSTRPDSFDFKGSMPGGRSPTPPKRQRFRFWHATAEAFLLLGVQLALLLVLQILVNLFAPALPGATLFLSAVIVALLSGAVIRYRRIEMNGPELFCSWMLVIPSNFFVAVIFGVIYDEKDIDEEVLFIFASFLMAPGLALGAYIFDLASRLARRIYRL